MNAPVNLPAQDFIYHALERPTLRFAWDDFVYFTDFSCPARQFFTSTNGGQSWDDQQAHFYNPTTTWLLADQNGRLFAVTCSSVYVQESLDNGETWSILRIGEEQLSVFDLNINRNNHHFALTEQERVYRSLDDGETWELLDIDIPWNFNAYLQKGKIHFGGDPEEIHINFFNEAARSYNNGDTWESTPPGYLFGYSEYSVHPNGDVYRYDDQGGLLDIEVLRAGAAEPESLEDLFHPFFTIDDFLITQEGMIFINGELSAINEPIMYRSTDNGASFEALPPIAAAQWTSNAVGDLFYANHEGVFRSVNDALSWEKYGEGFPEGALVTDLYVGPNQYLYAGLRRASVYRTSVPTTYQNEVYGTVSRNMQADCEDISMPAPVYGWKVKASGASDWISSTDTSGHYSLDIPDGNYEVQPLPLNPLWEVCQNPAEVELTEGPDTAPASFLVRPLLLCANPVIEIGTPFLRRCFENQLQIHYCNTGTVPLDNAEVHLTLDSLLNYVGADLMPATQAGQTLTFNVGTLQPLQCGSFTVWLEVSCDAQLGQTHCIQAVLLPDDPCIPDLNPTGESTLCEPNIGSYDPNDKMAFVNGRGPAETIDPETQWINYRIRFQNTGTDTAFQVIIEDPLPPELDPASIVPGASSHSYRYELTGQNRLRFIFEDIMLPDSNVNVAASIGFVQFKIAKRTDVEEGVSIKNYADIFFDFNAPIRTPTSALLVEKASHTLKSELLTGQLNVSPNPWRQRVRIELSSPWKEGSQLEVINSQGQMMYRTPLPRPAVTLEDQGWPAGLYIVQIREAKGRIVAREKMVIQ